MFAGKSVIFVLFDVIHFLQGSSFVTDNVSLTLICQAVHVVRDEAGEG